MGLCLQDVVDEECEIAGVVGGANDSEGGREVRSRDWCLLPNSDNVIRRVLLAVVCGGHDRRSDAEMTLQRSESAIKAANWIKGCLQSGCSEELNARVYDEERMNFVN